MSNDADGPDSDPKSGKGVDDQRGVLATKLIRYSFYVIGALIIGLVLLALGSATGVIKDTTGAALYREIADKIMTGILPLLGAWVGAIIAFYFGRDNYDAAARNVRQAMNVTPGDQLSSIFVKDVMVPANKLVTATMPGEKGAALQSGVLPRLEKRGLGRLVVVAGDAATTDNAPPPGSVAMGVVHDSVISRFIVSQIAAGKTLDSVTLGALLSDPEVARLLASAVVYVTPEATLADVRRKMDEASRNASATVRDVLVTATGKVGEPLLGYLTDIDLGDKGALK